MMKRFKITNFSMAAAILLGLSGNSAIAKENVGVTGNSNKGSAVTAADCNATTAQADLDINNVRTTILVGGDMWWALGSAPKYEIPINSGKHSIFAGALWIGGIDAGGQIKVAAQTYRQTGVDFWGGPIDTVNISISPDQCLAYDRHWKMTKSGVIKYLEGETGHPDYVAVKNDIETWPGNGNDALGQGNYLAPFIDVDDNGEYNFSVDYPGYNLSGDYPVVPGTPKTICNDYLFGDQTIWWVFNDVGNAHTETSSEPIGLEIRAQAFGFKTNDEINNMTFYKYQIINRSSLTLTETYFGQWVDPDLGNATDDYVGCDVPRGLGFCYNGDADDETASGYGVNPPAVGVDFFQGPIADLDDNVDNDRDSCEDCTFIDSAGVTLIIPDNILGEQIIMSKFVYYNNINGAPDGNPSGFTDFYNYLQGIWLDNQPISYGGDGRDINAPVCNFMFPGTTDPDNYLTLGEWSEFTAGNIAEDRRFLQSAGTFTLAPGAVNYITTGVVWARTQQGGPNESVELVRVADDKAQALFDNCFKLIDGPDAPNLVIRELNKKFIFSLQDYANPKVELYHQKDPIISGVVDSLTYFDFQGYQIYQMKDGSVTTGDIGNPDKIRLLIQCDIQDGVDQLVNFTFDPAISANVPVEMVNGADEGIKHTFVVDQDLFASGTTALVNHKTYYYTVVSYAYNQYKKYDQNDPAALDGQKKPYLAGRNNIKTYSGIPHISTPENSGQIFGSDYGDGPRIKRIEGQGNGGMLLNFADEVGYAELLKNPPYKIAQPEYLNGQGPLNLTVYDPTLVNSFNFETRFDGVVDTTEWTMINYEEIDTVFSERVISVPNEQVIPEWGLSATFTKVIEAGKAGAINNALLSSSIEYADPDMKWLNSIKDTDGSSATVVDYEDWIRSGPSPGPFAGLDDEEIYENVVDGTWAPFKLTTKEYPGPKPTAIAEAQVTLSPSTSSKTSISSVDIVITKDQSMWSRSAVVELGTGGTINGALQFDLRESPSVGKDGNPGDNTVSDHGMGWFPGYAVNVETGERLNIVFGENSSLADTSTHGNGGDMKWNPTSTRYLPGSGGTVPVFGGMHYIYVFGHNADDKDKDVPMYDECRFFHNKLDSATTANNNKRNIWKDAMYVSLPALDAAYDDLSFPNKNFAASIPSDVRIKIRVAKNYRTYTPSDILRSGQPIVDGTPYYVVSTPVTYNGTTYNTVGAQFNGSSTAAVFTGVGTVTSTPPVNGFNPLYTFGTGDLANDVNNINAAKDALQYVNVVPNPYYAFSSYETSQLDNRIKITNLPPNCTVSIFTMSGTLVRRFKRDVQVDNSEGAEYDPSRPNTDTSIDWDLKNQKAIPIASGMYLIHIEAPGIGEKTLKWFGMIRPIDLDTF
jgi:hypothetical protein